MMEYHDEHTDPVGALADLRAALAQPELGDLAQPGPHDIPAKASAYELALALGRCRLFGADIALARPGTSLDVLLPAHLALAAAEVLETYLGKWVDDAHTLEKRWDKTADMVEAEELCLGLLRARMEAWAVWVALDEVCQLALGQAPPDPRLTAVHDRLPDVLERFDRELQAQEELLSLAAGTNVLHNWRAMLAPAYRDNLPWWLDWTLEKAAERVEERALASLPSESVGQFLKEAIGAFRESVTGWLARLRLVPVGCSPGREPEYLPLRRWSHTDSEIGFLATLEMPQECETGESVFVNFFESSGNRASVLEKTPVWLASVPSKIDKEGRAAFLIEALHAARQQPTLEVGEERTLWQPQENGQKERHDDAKPG